MREGAIMVRGNAEDVKDPGPGRQEHEAEPIGFRASGEHFNEYLQKETAPDPEAVSLESNVGCGPPRRTSPWSTPRARACPQRGK